MRGCSGKSAGNFNPRPPCGGRLSGGDPFAKGYISTHALLAEGDGRRPLSLFASNTTFQPTPSLRRATIKRSYVFAELAISTHALLAEGDQTDSQSMTGTELFQPTPSLRRATQMVSP